MKECIYREDVIRICERLRDKTDNDDMAFALNWAIQSINNIPAVDVRPVVRGKLIPDYDYAEYDIDGSTPLLEPRKYQDGWQCSLCGQYMPSKENFCPNCGADMREINDEAT